MKKFLKISLMSLLTIGFYTSCSDDNNDTLSGNENVGGLITVNTTNVVYDTQGETNVQYSVDLNVFQSAPVKVNSIDVYKQFTDVVTGEVSNKVLLKNVPLTAATESENVSFSFTYLELVDGLTIGDPAVAVPTDDALINIGDKFTLSYVAKRNDGQDAVNVKTTNVVAACVSDLGGTYNTVTTRLATGAVYTVAGEVITDFGNATYTTSTTGNFKITTTTQIVTGAWNTNPGERGGFEFTEVCGKLFVASQNLHNTYSNLIIQSAAEADMSFVDPGTGVITIYYTITLASGNRAYRSIYTPI
jgi:hypothetical protein